MVILNNQGLFIAFLSQQLPQAFQAVEIEALAAARALEFASEIGIEQALLERDSEVIMKASVEEGGSLASYDLLIQDAMFCYRLFTQLSYSHKGMAMGRSGAEGWDLRPRPAWIFLAPSPSRPALRGKFLAPSPPLKAPRRPAKPHPTS